MEYTLVEQSVLNELNRVDFKNIKKDELISYVSKLNELRPEVATQIIQQFPELAGMIKTVAGEYHGMLSDIIKSDDASINQVYDVIDKQQKADADSRRQFYDMAEKVREDLAKGLNNPELSEEERRDIREKELEILRMASEKDSEIRADEKNNVKHAYEKDSEKRKYNWELVKVASGVAAIALGIGITAATGGEFKFKLPTKF